MAVPAGYKPVWIQGASVLINESTGAILTTDLPISLVACGPITVSADATLNSLLGAAVNASIKRLVLLPRTTDAVYMNLGGAATASTSLLPSGGLGFACESDIGTDLHLYATSNVVVDVYQFG